MRRRSNYIIQLKELIRQELIKLITAKQFEPTGYPLLLRFIIAESLLILREPIVVIRCRLIDQLIVETELPFAIQLYQETLKKTVNKILYCEASIDTEHPLPGPDTNTNIELLNGIISDNNQYKSTDNSNSNNNNNSIEMKSNNSTDNGNSTTTTITSNNNPIYLPSGFGSSQSIHTINDSIGGIVVLIPSYKILTVNTIERRLDRGFTGLLHIVRRILWGDPGNSEIEKIAIRKTDWIKINI